MSHELRIRTRYYNADIPIWLDEIASPDVWKSDFLSEEAREVVKAVGAWVVVFRRGVASDTEGPEVAVDNDDEPFALLAAVKDVIDQAHGGDGIWDGVCLAVGLPSSIVGVKEGGMTPEERSLETWEDLCLEYGFEYIAGDDRTKGRTAEGDLRGIARVREALEANDWNGNSDDEELEDEFEFANGEWGNTEDQGFGAERRELESEFANLTREDDDEGEDEAVQVEELGRMMQKMQATRGSLLLCYGWFWLILRTDMSAHLPLHERRKVAAKAVNALFKNG